MTKQAEPYKAKSFDIHGLEGISDEPSICI